MVSGDHSLVVVHRLQIAVVSCASMVSSMLMGSVVVAHGVGCPVTCRIF